VNRIITFILYNIGDAYSFNICSNYAEGQMNWFAILHINLETWWPFFCMYHRADWVIGPII